MSVDFKVVEHIITRQYNQERQMLAEFEAGNYTIEKPYVKLNPYMVAPLTALIMFQTEEEVAVTVTVKGKDYSNMKGFRPVYRPADIAHDFPKAKIHQLPVLGLYSDYENTVVLTLSNGITQEVVIKTDVAKDVSNCTYLNTTDDYMQDNLMFVTQSANQHTAGYDYNGDVRWYTTETFVFDMKRVRNGHILIGSDRFSMRPYYTTGVCEMSLVGKMYAEYRLPGAYHHDQFEMEDGNLLILTQDAGAATTEDICALVDRETGAILRQWDIKDVLPQDVAGSANQSDHDWFHNNSVWYDKNTNSITLSGRHQDAVINIDYETGKLNWILGDPQEWPQELVDQYFFTPVGDGEFDWQYEQHGAIMLENGDVMLFDNGHFRSKVKENYILNRDNFSRGVRYKINTEDMTIEQVWQYGKERGGHFISAYISNVAYYGEDHYMVHSGGIGFYNNYPTEKAAGLLSKMSDSNIELKSITVETKADKVMFEMHLEGNFYRANKLSLYHEGSNLEFGKGKLLGNLAKNEEMETEVPAEEVGELIPEINEVVFINEEDRINFDAKFVAGQLVMLELIELNSDRVCRYFIPTTRMAFKAMCVGTFQDSDERVVKYKLNKEGLSGTFEIKIIVDDKKYDTGVILKI